SAPNTLSSGACQKHPPGRSARTFCALKPAPKKSRKSYRDMSRNSLALFCRQMREGYAWPLLDHVHKEDGMLSATMQNYENLSFAAEGDLAVITLNRPNRRNALSLDLMLEQIGRSRTLRAVILAANGKVFSSGHDLSEMVGRDLNEYRRLFDVCSKLMEKIQSIPQPVIAQVQGIATAAGCQLVATCDLAVASDEAAFATPGVKIGLFCTTPMVALSRAIGRKRALQMLLTGEMVDAVTAAHWGLINMVV